MTLPDHADVARAYLEQWCPGYTTGQWAALVELLDGQCPTHRESDEDDA